MAGVFAGSSVGQTAAAQTGVQFVETYCLDCHSGEAASAGDALRQIADLKPELLLLDIEMPGGSGLDLLQEIGEPLPYVIFVTAHPEFALPAFEVQAADYLVKPVQRQRFIGSVLRAKQRIAERRVAGTVRAAALVGPHKNGVHSIAVERPSGIEALAVQ